MGYIRHHAIAVTGWNEDKIKAVRQRATEIFSPLSYGELIPISQILHSTINGFYSFFIGPDGSKEGWVDSDTGDQQRAEFIKYINSQAYNDGSNSISYCEFFYGDEDGEAKIVNHN